jgi:cysteine desulfurase
VITAMGVPVDWALGAVRTSLGAGTTAEDIDYVLEVLPAVVQRIRAMSPAGAA